MNFLGLVILFVIMMFIGSLILYVVSIFTSRSIKKKFPLLYVIGYKNGVVVLGAKSDSWVDGVGFIPVAKAKLKDGTVKSCGWVTYDLKPRFAINDPIPYNVKIVQYVQ